MNVKYFNVISALTLALASFMILLVSFVFFWPVEVIDHVVQPYKIITPIVKQGEDVIYIAEHCKNREATALINRSLSDGIIISIPEKPSNLPLGCHSAPIHVNISPKVPPGIYTMDIDIEYRINAYRSVFYHLKTEKFKVIKGDKISTETL